MEKFKSIYPFTTENIAGYMDDLNLSDKNVITVTGSADHVLNAVLKGANNILTFDVNPYAKYYLDLKIAAIKELSFEEFKNFLLYNNEYTLKYETILKLNMPKTSKDFWLDELNKFNNNGLLLKKSNLFNLKYYDINKIINCNLYLNYNNYDIIKSRLEHANITFVESNIVDLKINDCYDYMFLSNISDYLNLIYMKDYLINFAKLLDSFKVNNVYFAYLYDINNQNKRSEIDDLNKVKDVFKNIKIKKFKSALIDVDNDKIDAVLIREVK